MTNLERQIELLKLAKASLDRSITDLESFRTENYTQDPREICISLVGVRDTAMQVERIMSVECVNGERRWFKWCSAKAK